MFYNKRNTAAALAIALLATTALSVRAMADDLAPETQPADVSAGAIGDDAVSPITADCQVMGRPVEEVVAVEDPDWIDEIDNTIEIEGDPIPVDVNVDMTEQDNEDIVPTVNDNDWAVWSDDSTQRGQQSPDLKVELNSDHDGYVDCPLVKTGSQPAVCN